MNSDFEPLVSIVVPVFNGAKYMRQALDSALAQTYRNTEVIVVNDGSTDDTASIAASYGDAIRYFEKPNGGASTALNMGVSQMRGEYFSWLSHDDVYHPHKVGRQVAELVGLSDRRTIILSSYELIDARGRLLHHHDIGSHAAAKLNTPLYPLVHGIIHGCSMLISKSWFDELGAFDPELRSTQDYDLWFRFLRRAPVRFIPEPLIQSRLHPEQGTHAIPTHLAEANRLWKRFASEVSKEEAIAISGSQASYYAGLARFLETTSFSEALKHVQELAAKEGLPIPPPSIARQLAVAFFRCIPRGEVGTALRRLGSTLLRPRVRGP